VIQSGTDKLKLRLLSNPHDLSPAAADTRALQSSGEMILMTSLFRQLKWIALAAVALSVVSWGQRNDRNVSPGDSDESATPHLGYPQDWSSRHLVMSGANGKDPFSSTSREPRHVYNRVMREVAREEGRRHRDDDREEGRRHPNRRRRNIKVDWSVSLENGFVPANQFPAKYRFDVSSESCSGDYVVFGLTVASGSQANIVGINNLYTEATPKCNSGSPFVAFAYNASNHSGQIRTSPTISADGKKVAFVESTASASYFHVLVLPTSLPSPPTASIGTVLSPQTPSTCTTPTTANCMSTTASFGSISTASSPWIDYNTDTAYVGTDDGKLYKISPVFGGGAPAVVADTNWPVTVWTTGSSKVLTDPIVDDVANRIFMGDWNGYLYAISLSAPAKTTAARVTIGWVGHGAGTGVVDPPIVVNDAANPSVNQVFAFTGCSNVLGIGGAVSQIPANFTSSSSYVTVDLGSATGAGDCTTGNVHSGTFDNQFWTNGTTSGHILACGFTSGTNGNALIPSNPKIYMFPFDASHNVTGTGATSFVVNSTKGDECSPLTEFYNGTTDRLFFGVGSTTDSFIEASTITTTASTPICSASPTSTCVTAPKALGGTSGIIVDNQVSNGGTNIYFSTLAVGGVNGQKCNVSGGSANPYCAVKLTQSGLQ
jgi:hypothetical protein